MKIENLHTVTSLASQLADLKAKRDSINVAGEIVVGTSYDRLRPGRAPSDPESKSFEAMRAAIYAHYTVLISAITLRLDELGVTTE
jgi:hypothetical protein